MEYTDYGTEEKGPKAAANNGTLSSEEDVDLDNRD